MSKNKPPGGDPNFYRRKVTRELTFKLSTEDRARMMDETAELDGQIEELEDKKASEAAEYNKEIKDLEEKRKAISKHAREGEERKTVEAEEEYDYAADAIRTYFQGELKEERMMTIEERQLKIREVEEGAGKVTTLPKRKKTPGTGNGKAKPDHRKAAAGDTDEEDDELEKKRDLTAVIRGETGKTTKHSAVDGPRGDE